MAKKDITLSTPNVEVENQATVNAKKNDSKNKAAKKKANAEKRRKFVKFFQNIISELKKVSWSKFKSNKESKGVWAKTGVVLLIVFAFLILITAMDLGLSELLKLLVDAGTAV